MSRIDSVTEMYVRADQMMNFARIKWSHTWVIAYIHNMSVWIFIESISSSWDHRMLHLTSYDHRFTFRFRISRLTSLKPDFSANKNNKMNHRHRKQIQSDFSWKSVFFHEFWYLFSFNKNAFLSVCSCCWFWLLSSRELHWHLEKFQFLFAFAAVVWLI